MSTTDRTPLVMPPPRVRRRPNLAVFVRWLRVISLCFFAPGAYGLALLPLRLGGVRVGPLLAATVALSLVLGIGARARSAFTDVPRAWWVGGLAWPAFDVLWSAALITPAAVVATLPLAWLWPPLSPWPRAMAAGAALALFAASYGVWVRRHWVRRRRIDIVVEGLPAGLDGFRIVQLSDLHIGTATRASAAQRWVAMANAAKADLVAVTGDVLTSGSAFHEEVTEVLASLEAKHGVAFCLGNHDYYDEDQLCARLASRGVHVLRNESIVVEHGGARLHVAGVEDLWRGTADVARALTNVPAGETTLLLAHNPKLFPAAAAAGVTLTLSGHTHAGQVAVPFLVRTLNLARITDRHSAGHYREGSHHLFVHAGLGTTGPTFRLGAAPEVVELVLKRA